MEAGKIGYAACSSKYFGVHEPEEAGGAPAETPASGPPITRSTRSRLAQDRPFTNHPAPQGVASIQTYSR